jgi:hypothetical protein
MGNPSIYRKTVRHEIYKPAASSVQITGVQLTLKVILSRIPGLASVYEMTFEDLPQTGSLLLNMPLGDERIFQLQIDDSRQFTNRESLTPISCPIGGEEASK